MPHELTENRKQSSFEVSSYFISCNNNRQFLISIVTCDEKWILYDNWQWTAQWLDQEEAVNHFLKPNLHKGKGHGHYLVVCCQSNPLWLSESWRNNYISANQWDALKTSMPAAGLGQQKRPNSLKQHPATCFKSWANRAMKFCLICRIHLISHWPITTSLSISTTFYRENISTISRRQKMLFKSLSNPEVHIFTLQE